MSRPAPATLGDIAATTLGALAGGLGTRALMPHLRAVDPLGYSPIVLIVAIGVGVLGLYLRGRLRPRATARP